MAKHRASPDVLHFRYWDLIFDHVQDDLMVHFNDIVQTGRCPVAFKGAEVVPIKKKNKCPEYTASYRPIMLMLSTAKLFSRLCMQKLVCALTSSDAMPKTQHAMGPAAGVELPHLAMTQCMALAASMKHSLAIVYLDIKSAFDAVLRQLLLPVDHERHESAHSLHLATGRPLDECIALVHHVRTQPMSLVSGNLPQSLVNVLKDWTTDTWFMPRSMEPNSLIMGSAAAPLTPATGVRQGDNLSALLFAVYIDQALDRVSDFILQSSCHFAVPLPHNRDLEISTEHVMHIITMMVYADDVTIPLHSANPGTLLTALGDVLKIAGESLSKYNFVLNTSVDKTAISLALRSPHAPNIWQHIRDLSVDTFTSDTVTAPDRILGDPKSTHRTVKLSLPVEGLGRIFIQQ
eukprot:2501117-Amphidinium_carterae.2